MAVISGDFPRIIVDYKLVFYFVRRGRSRGVFMRGHLTLRNEKKFVGGEISKFSLSPRNSVIPERLMLVAEVAQFFIKLQD